MRWDSNNVRNGMFVTGTNGERLGKVIRCDQDTFVVEKGTFFPKDYELRYNHITDIKDGTIVYSLTDLLRREEEIKRTTDNAPKEPLREMLKEPLKEAPKATAATAATTAAATGAATAADRTRLRADGKDEIRIPLMQEELGVEKVTRDAGHVRIHKAVRTEEKHVTVPVTREDVTIEHVAPSGSANLAEREMAFKEENFDVPLHEEDVRVTKRSTLREEVVVRTVAQSIEKDAAATLRFEEAEVEDTRKTAPLARDEATGYSSPGYGSPGYRR
jgi:uncharacterized protein (TIGR02271 family)